MCRFLIVKSKNKINPAELLKSFALACQKSVAPDGELQKDGYGIAYHDGQTWQLKKSLAPIWEEQDSFEQIPETNLFVAHARSSGFAKDKDNLNYNQPFTDGSFCFVFNGMIRKIKLNLPLEGMIGSQKLFSLIKLQLKKHQLENVLKNTNKIILENSEKIEGMNIGLINDSKIYILCQYSNNKEYFTLHVYQDKNLTIVSSIPFGSYKWKPISKGEVKVFS